MSKSFVRPPVEDRMINNDGYLTESWRQWFLDTWQSMDELSSEAGVQFPVLTTTQRDSDDYINQAAVTSGALNGLVIYNSTANQVQAVVAGAWAAL